MREALVAELVREVLGPRGGPTETIRDSPLDEYLTGVLAPFGVPVAPDIDAEAELPSQEDGAGREDDQDEPETTPAPMLAPALSPQSRPPSFGLSFVVHSPRQTAAIDVCLTWARYVRANGGWLRQPRVAVLQAVLCVAQTVWLDGSGATVRDHQRAEVSFHVFTHPLTPELTSITLFFANRLPAPEEGRQATAEHHIFQPQIRVMSVHRTRIVPAPESLPQTAEERELEFLYRHRPVLGRGYLCSAVWRAIDPQRGTDAAIDFPDVLRQPPFYWVDGDRLDASQRAHFALPEVRTEFVPLYGIDAPDLDWPLEFGEEPELSAERLAELWEPAELERRLGPLARGYRRWIDGQRTERNARPRGDWGLADQLIQRCEGIATRIETGVHLLRSDESARLAFCFAMKAIAVQSTWPVGSGRASLRWHPFQLGFILMTLESITHAASRYRDVCDLLWVATGVGKTEAYLALSAFAMAYRRRRALQRNAGDVTGAGTAVISRYTLRLLTIQQFRRALKIVTACEMLRVAGAGSSPPIGWRPPSCPIRDDYLWGTPRFSVGLWVGGSVTPNYLRNTGWGFREILGAISILKAQGGAEEAEPAQVLRCPACDSVLAVPRERDGGLPGGQFRLHLTLRGVVPTQNLVTTDLNHDDLSVRFAGATSLPHQDYSIVSLDVSANGPVSAEAVDSWWAHFVSLFPGLQLACARASRPGYFIRWYRGTTGQPQEYDFDIFCTNPSCSLLQAWCEGIPLGCKHGVAADNTSPRGGVPGLPGLPDGNRFAMVIEAFRSGSPYMSGRIPIPAWTIDEQVYHRCPSMVVATVDKFARPPFEPRAAAIFGNVDYHHCVWGYYRAGQHPAGSGLHPTPAGRAGNYNYVQIPSLDPPDLILQDELHLIEGPLGSLVGLYETAVDALCGIGDQRVKYVASTATIRQATDQVQAIFSRNVQVFPSPGLTVDNRFFTRSALTASDPLDDHGAGRLYLGICAPGRGPLTPVLRIWARLLQTTWRQRTHPRIDPFWTLAGYFNAIRELAGARALYRQDIPERIQRVGGTDRRPLSDERSQELSSAHTASTELPFVLDLLNVSYPSPNAQDALFTTSMFGTGVDIPRLGLMVVHGQPKTTSSYIQATGRVGRNEGALIVTFLRAARPRDLNHYEFFCGYHCQLHRFVEPVTVMPFAPGAVERAIGPLAVLLLRNQRATTVPWHDDASAPQMATVRATNPEVQALPGVAEARGQSQPVLRRPPPGSVLSRVQAALDDWHRIANLHPAALKYVEYALAAPPGSPVVLGDAHHQHAGLDVVYQNAPQSLRDIEETCGFETR